MSEHLVQAHGIHKTYGATRVLTGVDLDVQAGEVVGLLGKNGAGKSTLIKILAGVQRSDGGSLALTGRPVALDRHTAVQAKALGLAVMYQELEIFPGMTVAENIALGAARLPHRLGCLVDRRRLLGAARTTLSRIDHTIDPRAGIDTLTAAQQRAVVIARAVHQGARVLVLDEPTTSLTAREITALHALVRRLADHGHGIVYVSHRLQEITQVTDRVVIMRDGQVVVNRPTARMTIHDLITGITGDTGGTTAAQRRAARGLDQYGQDADADGAGAGGGTSSSAGVGAGGGGRERLAVAGLSCGVLHDVDMRAYAGEILGIAGLVGSGRSELLRGIFGADAHSGTITVDGIQRRITCPRQAVGAGVVLVPEDRRHQGLVGSLSIRKNITLAALPSFRRGRLPVPSRRRETALAATLIRDLDMRAEGPEQGVRMLSGGTQQKVVIGKWMLRAGGVLMFDEPTQGIDVRAKEDVYRLLEQFAADGAAVVFVSSEFSELVALCHRVLVLREGRVVRALSGGSVTEEAITAACYSDSPPGPGSASVTTGPATGPATETKENHR